MSTEEFYIMRLKALEDRIKELEQELKTLKNE